MEPRSWRDVPEERLNDLITRQMRHTANLTVARLQLAKGAVVPLHEHANEQITMLESGRLVFHMDGREITVTGGQMLEIPSGVPHRVEAMEDSVAIDLFAPRREDWIRGDDAYLRK